MYFGGTLDFISKIVCRPRQQDQPVDDARRREGQEPCTKAAPWRGGYVEKGIGHSRNRSGAIITHTLTDDATTELTLIDAVDGGPRERYGRWSRQVGCRESPSNHAGDKRLRGQAGDGVDPRGAVAAVTTAQAEREFCHAHVGMGAWVGQHLGGIHACLTTAGTACRDEHPCTVGASHPAASY